MPKRLLVAVDVPKFRKLLKVNGTTMTQLEKELGKPIRKYIRNCEMPKQICATITSRFGVDYDTFINHKEELLRDMIERVKDMERMVYLLRNENKILVRDNERLSAIVYSYEMLYAEEDDE